MDKKRMAIAVIIAICIITACVQKLDSEERGGIRGAMGAMSARRARGWKKEQEAEACRMMPRQVPAVKRRICCWNRYCHFI